MRVTKRDGNVEAFKPSKVKRSLLLAFNAVQPGAIPNVAPLVKEVMGRLLGEDELVSSDKVGDLVEAALLASGHTDAARRYIIYRHERRRPPSPDKWALPNYIVASKYARWNGERREVYSEAVSRVGAMHTSWLQTRDLSPDAMQQVLSHLAWVMKHVQRKDVLPSMRTMQFGGEAVLTNNLRSYNCSATVINRWEAFSQVFYLLLCGCGVGYSVQWQHVEQLGAVVCPGRRVVHHTVQDSIEGWADAAAALISGYTSAPAWVEFDYSRIRPEGAPLITSGGRAPGHLPLRRALEAVRAILQEACGRRLRPVECSDILCIFAQAVLSGGIRRSSMLGLFSAHDTEMLYAKARGNFRPAAGSDPGLNAHRAMANLSAALLRGSTHRSMFDRIIRVSQENFGDPGFVFLRDLDHCTNPCFVESTLLHTRHGLYRIRDLVGQGKNEVTQLNGNWLPASEVTLTGKDVPVYKVTLQSGHSVTVTGYHRFPTMRGRLKTKELRVGDKLFLQKECGGWGSQGTYEEGLILGLWFGDGTSSDRGDAWVCLWGEDQRWAEFIRDIVNSTLDSDYEWKTDGARMRLGGARLGQFIGSQSKSYLPPGLFRGSYDYVRGFLEGLVFTDGSIMGNEEKSYSLRISQSNKRVLEEVQILLSNFGIQSVLHLRRLAADREMPGGIYNYEIILSRNNAVRFVEQIGLFGPKWDITATNRKVKYWSKVVSIEPAGCENVYCLNQPKTNELIANGILTLNCGEVSLDPWLKPGDLESKSPGFAFCNLTEVNVATCTSRVDFLARCRAAAVLGTIQAGYTSFPYLGPVSEAIARRDALLGVSLTGIQNNRKVFGWLRAGSEVVLDTNMEISRLLGINPAARCCCVKPSGKASLVLGVVGPGIHPLWAERYFHRVTANPNEPCAQEFRRVNPHMVEVMPSGDWSITFPIVHSGATVQDMSGLNLLDDVLTVYDDWVVPGGRDGCHSVSCSLNVRPDEVEDVVDAVWSERDRLVTLSFIPLDIDTRFPYAPRQAVQTAEDEARWLRLIEGYRPVDWGSFKELTDRTCHIGEVACGGGACEI